MTMWDTRYHFLTISLSMALTLPFMMDGNQEFIYRNDLLFIASFMVLTSLIAQVVLPFITPSEKVSEFKGMSYQSAKIFMVQQVLDAFKKKTLKKKYRLSTNIKSIF